MRLTDNHSQCSITTVKSAFPIRGKTRAGSGHVHLFWPIRLGVPWFSPDPCSYPYVCTYLQTIRLICQKPGYGAILPRPGISPTNLICVPNLIQHFSASYIWSGLYWHQYVSLNNVKYTFNVKEVTPIQGPFGYSEQSACNAWRGKLPCCQTMVDSGLKIHWWQEYQLTRSYSSHWAQTL